MKLKLIGLVAAAALFSGPAVASALNAKLYVGHGINGSDLGLPTDLPVDVCTSDGAELLSNVTFRTITPDPLSLPAGIYGVEIRLADAGTCTGALAVAAQISLGVTESATALAHLNEQGTPTITKFVNDVRPTSGHARVVARHAAAAPDVNVLLRKGRDYRVIRRLENPDQEAVVVRPGRWFVGIYPAWSWRNRLFKANLNLAADTAYFAYAVGSTANKSFEVLLQSINLNGSSAVSSDATGEPRTSASLR